MNSSVTRNPICSYISRPLTISSNIYDVMPNIHYTNDISRISLQRIARQLLEATIFEKMVDSVVIKNEKNKEDSFYFTIKGKAYICFGRVRGFGRVRLHIDSLKKIRTTEQRLLSNDELEKIIFSTIEYICEGNPQSRQNLKREIGQTLYWIRWNAIQIKRGAIKAYRDWDSYSYQDYEVAIHEGHPYHPCFKARIGFSEEDHKRYSSECKNSFQLYWIAVPLQTLDKKMSADIINFWRHELTYSNYYFLENKLMSLCVNANDFTFMPVHPWQWDNYLLEKLQSRIDSGDIFFLGACGDTYLASQSMRTLMNKSNPLSANIKIPMDMINTSSSRYLFKYGIHSAESISSWLEKIVESDNNFSVYPLVILQEYKGLCVDESFYQTDIDSQACHLGVIFRESIESKLLPYEQAIPLNALFTFDSVFMGSINGREIKHNSCSNDWIVRYGLRPWVKQLIRIVVLPIWNLLIKHGIALEAHSQNLILIHQNGWPTKLAVRDFHESLEYVPSFLSDDINIPDFLSEWNHYKNAKPDQFYWMESIESLRWLVMDTLFVFNLSEIAQFLDDAWGFSESDFWVLVQEILLCYEETHTDLSDRIKSLNFFSDRVKVESLLAKKCHDIPSSKDLDSVPIEYYHYVDNSLFHI